MSAPVRKIAAVVPIQRPKSARSRRMRGHHVGVLLGRDERGVLVDYPGNPHGPLVARSTIALRTAPATERREALLVFEEERSDRPVVVGLLASEGVEVTVDGRRVVLQALDEIVLQCGESSITLRRNGRVVIRGAYVETRSRGVNRIKGGSVQIN